MKRKILSILLAFGLAAMASAAAQGEAEGQRRENRQRQRTHEKNYHRHQEGPRRGLPEGNQRSQREFPAVETVTVTGSLTVAHGTQALKSGDITYIITGINRLVGFIDDLKEGAQVRIEGSAITSPRDSNLKLVRPSQMTLNGRTYDLSSALPSRPNRYNAPQVPPGKQRRQHSRGDRQTVS